MPIGKRIPLYILNTSFTVPKVLFYHEYQPDRPTAGTASLKIPRTEIQRGKEVTPQKNRVKAAKKHFAKRIRIIGKIVVCVTGFI